MAGATATASGILSGAEATADLAQALTGDLVLIEGEGRPGIAFLTTLDRRRVLIANPRAVLAHKTPQFTLLDHSMASVAEARVAVGADLLLLSLSGTSAHSPREAMTAVDKQAAAGDEIVVLSVSTALRTPKAVPGTILGITPNLVELEAPITRADEGSPVIHRKTGAIIGLATSITEIIQPAPGSSDRPLKKQRHYAMRLDAVKKWQVVSWPQLYAEGALLEKARLLTRDLENARFQMEHEGVLHADSFRTPEVQSPVQDFVTLTSRGRISSFDMTMAKKEVLAVIRKACTQDIQPLRQKLSYDYFQRALEEEAINREALEKFFGAQLDSTSSGSRFLRRNGAD